MPEDGGMGKHRSAEEIGWIIEEFESSGLTRREFCHRQGIAITTLDSWRRTQSRRRPQMVEVEVDTGREPAQGFKLSLANGRRIESSWRFRDADLARLIRVVERAG